MLTHPVPQATSVDAERAFSRGCLTVSCLRHSLNDASVRANTVLGSWARIPGLVAEDEMIEMLANKKGRQRTDLVSNADGTLVEESEARSETGTLGIEDDEDLYA